jgi:lipoprotein-anchoring transpeptidase ErfK/SrfK
MKPPVRTPPQAARHQNGIAGMRRGWGVTAAVVAAGLTLAGCAASSTPVGAPAPPAASVPTPAPAASVAITPTSAAPVSPATPIVILAQHGTLQHVSVTDTASGRAVLGALTAGGTRWSSTAPLDYATSYTVLADTTGPGAQPTQQQATVTTITPAATAYANVVPAPKLVQHNGIGVGQPMVFQFTAPVVNRAAVQRHLHVTTTPPQPGAWYWIDNQHVHYRGAQYWQPGTHIHLAADVYGIDVGNGVFGAENNTADYTVHDSWIAKADGATHQLAIFHNNHQVRTMPTSLGSPTAPSHEGPHIISAKQPSIIMDSCTYGVCQGQPGYYRERVALDERISNDGEFVHSAPWSVAQQGNSNVSHGCVNLSPTNAQWFYDHFGIGDVVDITHSGGPPLPLGDTYGDWAMPWSQWQGGNATT